ncbi:MAG TPA: transketolase C-terminal domain-containing protein [Candidatus Binataceae bacterium]|nr:transketolase C-terminal domain-containing protein [Candidatus Binataceae bacterium]
MRTAFFNALLSLAEENPRVCLVVGDLGFGQIEPFAQRFPERYLNAGVAEQNMTGIAAGMALFGKTVFTYSIANFPTLRCLEQIRNDVCYHKADVKIVAVGGGFAYGALGMTHHATEDLAIMRSLPGMTVVAPGDPIETDLLTRALVEHRGPAYLRLGRAGEAKVHAAPPAGFRLGKALQLRGGRDLTLISTGGMLETAIRVADELRGDRLSCRVLSMHTLKPLDNAAVLAAASETGAIFTLEEHSIIGGLGGAVAEVLAESGGGARLKRLGARPEFSPIVGGQDYLRGQHGLAPAAIAETVRVTLRTAKSETFASA